MPDRPPVPITARERRRGRAYLAAGLFFRIVTGNLWVFYLGALLGSHVDSLTLVWSIAMGPQLFYQAHRARRTGQRILSHTLAHCHHHGLVVDDEIPLIRPSRRTVALVACHLLVALGIYSFCLDRMATDLRPAWMTLLYGAQGAADPVQTVRGMAWAVFGVGIGTAAVMHRAARYLGPVVPSPAALVGTRYVLYLRPFQVDRKLSRSEVPMATLISRGIFLVTNFDTEELRIAQAFEWAGRMVAVGRSARGLGSIGSPRIFLPDDWRPPVRRLMENARLTVLVLDPSDSMVWELGEAVRILPPERLVVLVRYDRATYDRVCESVRHALRARGLAMTFPPYTNAPRAPRTKITGILCFEAGWRARFVPLEHVPFPEDQLVGSLDRALRPSMTNLHRLEEPTG